MMKNMKVLRGALFALLTLAVSLPAVAQTVNQQPMFVAPRTVVDFGNGPLEMKFLTGNGAVFTSQASAITGTVSNSTTMTLIAPWTTSPCVGCVVSGTGIPAASTVTISALVGTTTLTLSLPVTVATGTTVSYGVACPTSTQTAPVQPTQVMAMVQAGQTDDLPFYTQARVCGYGAVGPGMQLFTFQIGAH